MEMWADDDLFPRLDYALSWIEIFFGHCLTRFKAQYEISSFFFIDFL